MLRFPPFLPVLLAISLLAPVGSLAQSIEYVDANTSASESNQDGDSWSTAYDTVTEGINDAAAGDSVWVTKGTYFPDEGPNKTDNDQSESFTIDKDITVIGRFEGDESKLSDRFLDRGINTTTLSGEIQQEWSTTGKVSSDLSDNSTHVVEQHDGTLQDVRIAHGNADGIGKASGGGGIYVTGDTLKHVYVQRNKAKRGGGLLVEGSPVIKDNVIVNQNEATVTGGGAYFHDDAATVNNMYVRGNTSNGVSSIKFVDSNADFGQLVVGGDKPDIESSTSQTIDVTARKVGNDLFNGGSGYSKTFERGIFSAGVDTAHADVSDGSDTITLGITQNTDSVRIRHNDTDFTDDLSVYDTETGTAPNLRDSTTYPTEPDYYDNPVSIPKAKLANSYELRVIPAMSPEGHATYGEYGPHINQSRTKRWKKRVLSDTTYDEIKLYVEDNSDSWENKAKTAFNTFSNYAPYPTTTPEVVADTDSARQSRDYFNAITYRKGAPGNITVHDSGYMQETLADFGNDQGEAYSEGLSAFWGGDSVGSYEPNDTFFDSNGQPIDREIEFAAFRVMFSIPSEADIHSH